MMERQKLRALHILPVMFGFFVMGFVDIIGLAINYVKQDFDSMTDTVANMLTISCYVWFLVLSVPTVMLIDKVGRKYTVLLSFLLHAVALAIPVVSYDFSHLMVAFAFVGIGNTLLQVALNPLVTDVVSSAKLTGTLTLGQFVKAVCSFLGPILVTWTASMAYGWKLVFPIYALTSLVALVWLWLTPITKSKRTAVVSFSGTFGLFRDRHIVWFFIGILVLVGADVGMNATFPKLLMEKCGLTLGEAGLGNSVYFFARTLGAFVGGILLMRYAEVRFFRYSVFVALAGLFGMFASGSLWLMLACVSIFGLGYANLFAIVFSLSMKRMPDKANEVSALLIMGVSGGAVVTPVLGIASDRFGTQLAALVVIVLVWLYLVWLNKHVRTANVAPAR